MTDSPSNALGALCDVPFSPIDWSRYDDIRSALAPDEAHMLSLLSLSGMGQKFIASHREWTSPEKAVPMAELLDHLGVSNYEIITGRGTVTLEELQYRKTLCIMSIDSRGDICIDDLQDKSKNFGEEISRLSFGNGDKPFVLLFGKKPTQPSPAVLSVIKVIRKLIGTRLIFFPL